MERHRRSAPCERGASAPSTAAKPRYLRDQSCVRTTVRWKIASPPSRKPSRHFEFLDTNALSGSEERQCGSEPSASGGPSTAASSWRHALLRNPNVLLGGAAFWHFVQCNRGAPAGLELATYIVEEPKRPARRSGSVAVHPVQARRIGATAASGSRRASLGDRNLWLASGCAHSNLDWHG